MDTWNTTFLLGRPIFRGELLVSGRVAPEEKKSVESSSSQAGIASWQVCGVVGGGEEVHDDIPTNQWLLLSTVPLKGGTVGGIVLPPIGSKKTTYIPLIVLAEPGGVSYMLPIPPFRGTISTTIEQIPTNCHQLPLANHRFMSRPKLLKVFSVVSSEFVRKYFAAPIYQQKGWHFLTHLTSSNQYWLIISSNETSGCGIRCNLYATPKVSCLATETLALSEVERLHSQLGQTPVGKKRLLQLVVVYDALHFMSFVEQESWQRFLKGCWWMMMDVYPALGTK